MKEKKKRVALWLLRYLKFRLEGNYEIPGMTRTSLEVLLFLDRELDIPTGERESSTIKYITESTGVASSTVQRLLSVLRKTECIAFVGEYASMYNNTVYEVVTEPGKVRGDEKKELSLMVKMLEKLLDGKFPVSWTSSSLFDLMVVLARKENGILRKENGFTLRDLSSLLRANNHTLRSALAALGDVGIITVSGSSRYRTYVLSL